MESANQIYCKNCGAIVNGLFCSNCGQRTTVDRVTFKETFKDLADNLFSLSAPLPLTLKMLIVDPGTLLRDYLGGKRKKYYRPISFFILSTLIYLFIRWLIDFDNYIEISIGANKNRIDLEQFWGARNYMFQNIKSLAFIFVFTLGIFIKLFFRSKKSLAESIAVSFYLNGIYSLLATLNLFYIKFVNPKTQYLAMVVMCAYFVYAMISLFRDQQFRVGLKSFLIYWLAYGTYVFLAINISYLIVMFEQF